MPEASYDERLLRRLYGQFLGGGEGLSQETDVSSTAEEAWRNRVQELVASREVGTFEGLILALATLFEVWEEPAESDSGQVQPALHMLLGLAAPAGETVELHFETPKAALVLQPGSLLAGFTLESIVKAKSWVATVVAKGIAPVWRVPRAASKRLVEGARQNAQKQGARHSLWRLDELNDDQKAALQEKDLVLIFLHGMFSTDLGTFDGLIDRLYTRDPDDLASLIQSAAQNPARLRKGKGLGVDLSQLQSPPPMPPDAWLGPSRGPSPGSSGPKTPAWRVVGDPEASLKELVKEKIGMVG